MELPNIQDFEASKLGTKSYWDTVYDRENDNFKEIGDIGEIWFGEESVEKMVEWVTEQATDPDTSIIDLGCGNGHLLLELSQEGYRNLHGIDYSESAIKLAKAVAKERGLDWIRYDAVDFLTNPNWAGSMKYKLILDKGTYDAISLHPDQVTAKKEGLPGPREKYVESVRQLIDPKDGYFLISSCNWTKEELIENFKQCKSYLGYALFKYNQKLTTLFIRYIDFTFHSNVEYPVFEFGGHSGSKIVTVAFTLNQ
ncbi:S-adenosyl-L-methionine-dependent methyltransferase [Mycotypha africana]|uniref:S-adenosyl-L-methionine-dependent methyltransferase n=1 Tax=Mycotypha africana TaxID=64632 RepID=UPI0023017EAD|nr:S-adenosyl-L-methionine-dependent methyltransferase [Mycotypha africana]KAI8988419.1 S-adenosyl-L-methionine-dependent methyltransferase [Mycotypha africana]